MKCAQCGEAKTRLPQSGICKACRDKAFREDHPDFIWEKRDIRKTSSTNGIMRSTMRTCVYCGTRYSWNRGKSIWDYCSKEHQQMAFAGYRR